MKAALFLLPAILLFTACSDNNAGATRLTGTAAVGAPLQGSVYLKNADGTILNTTTDASGRYSMPEGHGYPALLMVEGRANGTGPLVQLYSWATGPGTLNLTPATHAIVSLALQEDPCTIIPAALMKAAGAPRLRRSPTWTSALPGRRPDAADACPAPRRHRR
jgi:hypothetical protein